MWRLRPSPSRQADRFANRPRGADAPWFLLPYPRAAWAPRCAVWLSLLGVLRAQTSLLLPLPTQPQLSVFHSHQFQGAWFVRGLAGNSFKKQDRALLGPYTTVFELKSNGHFEMSNSMMQGKHCDTWSYLLVPAPQPGRFTVDHGGPGADTEQVQVVDTNYTSFALLLSHRQAAGQPVIRVSLLARTWTLPAGTPEKFIRLSRAQGLTEDNIVFLATARDRAHRDWHRDTDSHLSRSAHLTGSRLWSP
ncbi:epididymal-specific lipocalin-12 [Fukomys damarensis]|uniref:epididymal-specific lipocalin-12 n=1 Tax=Fukomys damarensis TaxID=885580 RepID=UPI00053FE34C|nr:epididymal-specific lipocalin-12 [Fukomys damarensis]